MRKGRRLKAMLERVSGEEEVEFTIPHPFLPPRYREMSNRTNMILVLDRDMTLHVKWEGARLSEWNSITPGECRRIVASVLHYLSSYREELRAFSRFVDAHAEMPFDDPRFEPGTSPQERAQERPAPVQRESKDRAAGVPVGTSALSMALGGESPCPSWEW